MMSKREKIRTIRSEGCTPWKDGLSKEHYRWIKEDPGLLFYIINWTYTPQGSTFWLREYRSKTLSPEADLILRSWVNLKPRKIKPIEWV